VLYGAREIVKGHFTATHYTERVTVLQFYTLYSAI